MHFSGRRFIASIQHALQGIVFVFRHEQNFRIEILAAVAVVGMALMLPLRTWELVMVLFLVVMVLVAELINTAMEHLLDLLQPRLNHYVGTIKDMASAMVLLISLCAIIIGGIIFFPHFINLLK